MTASIPLDIPINNKNYGFVIDNRKCIGCHACSVACKSENEVPLSVNRTWVKYVETGAYPNSTRHFQVTRCNHCENPPCTRICPTEAMYQRDDGIVEFDNSVCIGCKACMQACPYDAIYIDPENGTAAKCHYCGHRTEVGLEPACVTVCPEHAIISGDMNDPNSEIATLLATQKVTVRKPEQGTSPKLFYINGSDVAMHPTATERVPETFMWADALSIHGDSHSKNGHSAPAAVAAAPRVHSNGTALRQPNTQSAPQGGPIQIGKGRMAEQMVQVAYNAQHLVPWHWPVPAYLVTKGIGSGIFMIFALGLMAGWFNFDLQTMVLGGFMSLLFIGITTALLIGDLERPERFYYMLIRPQWRSWLTRGAFLLIGFTVFAGLWWLMEAGALAGFWGEMGEGLRLFFFSVGSLLALGTAVYTAFLFAQAEGRDLWQSPLLPVHLVVQAFMVGAAEILTWGVFGGVVSAEIMETATTILLISIGIDLLVTLMGEFGIPHASEAAARASHDITHGRYKNHFWLGSILLGHTVPVFLILLFGGSSIMGVIAGVCTIVGLYFFEYAFVMAPQDIPNS